MQGKMKELGELVHLFVSAFLFHFAAYMIIPATTDITMEALCPGQDACSLAIYLTGFQQAATGFGAIIVTPLVGNLSDKYGRKTLLMLPTTITVLPLAILAYNQTREFIYAYYAVKMVAGMFADGCMQCLSLAYVADRVCERRRASAFAMLLGVSTAGFVCGTLLARLLPVSSTFQVATVAAMATATYVRLFLEESNPCLARDDEEINKPLCSTSSSSSSDGESLPRLTVLRKRPSLSEMINLLTSSSTLSRAAVIAFFHSLGENGLHTALLYYLKARFHFSKDQFADLLLIIGIVGTFSQLTLMPFLAPKIDEEKLLTVGLLASCAHVFLYSIAWSYWVPYLAASFVMLSIFVNSCIRSIVSKKVGSTEQGMAQGCITGVSSFASVICPLIFTPLTAWFLSDNAPFNFKGFSIMCAGFATLTALVASVTILTGELTAYEGSTPADEEQNSGPILFSPRNRDDEIK
ncbi:Major facilitator superfamily protein [Rhynchospora pubera]|uniref:Major facilitator superfamily protein n=2 Tax=Rhynchospora pubera TaxID=906938 RepID=A0AAV8EGC1_9POAL|nr:Major facilitator superfamily protein [Rhynchospora pubera]KAJ4784695.1 Major facilitator superfamily protein [Rhynchospora pubera]